MSGVNAKIFGESVRVQCERGSYGDVDGDLSGRRCYCIELSWTMNNEKYIKCFYIFVLKSN